MLRIVMTADPYIPVPPRLYGGIERIVHLVVQGLVRRGHRVTLFSHPESTTPADIRPYGAPPHTGQVARARWLWQLSSGLWSVHREADVIHSFGRLAALLPVLPVRSLPKVQSYQRVVPWRGVSRAARLGGSSVCFTGCSTQMYAPEAGVPRPGAWRTIFNGVDVTRYTASLAAAADAPLVFLGRVQPQKGPHHAIAIARRAGRRLVIAGNVEQEDARFFDEAIRPHVDGERITYVGPVDDGQKNALLGTAVAMLMPIECDEAFGIVMAEAMACGTPVIGFPRGSVAEVIREGVTGFVCATIDEAAAAVPRVRDLDRAAIRRDCERRFSDEIIVSQYEALYYEMIGRVRAAA